MWDGERFIDEKYNETALIDLREREALEIIKT